MHKVKTILLDIDGVVANIDSVFVSSIKELSGIDIDLMTLKSWDLFDIEGVKAYEKDVFKHIEKSKAVLNLAEYDGAIDFVNSLKSLGRVVACTASIYASTFPSERATWIINKLGLSINDIVFARDKSLVRGDYLIDDSISNIFNWALANPNKKALHFQTPGRNTIKVDACPGNVDFCKGYNDVLELIGNDIKREKPKYNIFGFDPDTMERSASHVQPMSATGARLLNRFRGAVREAVAEHEVQEYPVGEESTTESIHTKIDKYFSLTEEIGKYFDVYISDGIEDCRDCDWALNGENEVHFMEAGTDYDPYNDDEMTYAEEVNEYTRKGGLVLVNSRTCTGDGNVNFLFDEDKEIEEYYGY